ncbi:MAG: DUF1254 domain-containing protein [Pseudomonadota bacterium]
MIIKQFATAALCALAFIVPARAGEVPVTEQDAYEIGLEAYAYTYPLVTMELTRRQITNVAAAGTTMGRAPVNTLIHMRAYPPASYRDVVRPNFDTLYSFAWLDLRREPMLITVPASKDRYYLLPMLDMWTEVFASPGTRTTGNGPHTFAVVAPGWHGKLPAGVERIDATTPVVLMAGRSQTNGVADYPAVHAFQDAMRLVPLSQWGKPPAPQRAAAIDPAVNMKTPPMRQVNALPAAAYFKLAAELMGQHPAHATDQPIMARMRRLGLIPGRPFELAAQEPTVQRALEKAVPDGLKLVLSTLPRMAPRVNGWMTVTENIGNFGNSYLSRATVALVGLGANPPQDAVYAFAGVDTASKPLNGNGRHTIHFEKGELPPARAFWSVTLYDAEGFPIENEKKRYAIGDLAGELKYDPDGSLTLYLQGSSPGAEFESNWLPTPPGPFNLVLRVYHPKPAVLNRAWQMPGVVKTD